MVLAELNAAKVPEYTKTLVQAVCLLAKPRS